MDEWSIKENKYLRATQVRLLRTKAFEAKGRAVRQNRATPVKDWFLVELCLATGLRVQEAADLRESDLSLAERPCHVNVRCGKGGKARKVTVSDAFREFAAEYLAWKDSMGELTGGDAPLFLSGRTGGQMCTRALQKSFKRSLHRAGIPEIYGIHCLRHTYGTFLYEASGHNLRMVQRQLGHSSIKTTQVYVGVMDGETEKALDRLYGERGAV